MQIEMSARTAKYALSIVIPLAAGAYLLGVPAKTKTPTTATKRDNAPSVETGPTAPTIPRQSPGPINNPRTKNPRPRPTDNKYHTKPRPRSGKPTKKTTKPVPAG